eukprot:3481223-Pyramimonas_sp.AAC.1
MSDACACTAGQQSAPLNAKRERVRFRSISFGLHDNCIEHASFFPGSRPPDVFVAAPKVAGSDHPLTPADFAYNDL